MIKILLHGANGKMGHVLQNILSNEPDLEIVAGIDPHDGTAPFPLFQCFSDCTVQADVIIDFSTATAVPALLQYQKETKTPAVICTTGIPKELDAEIQKTAAQAAVLKSANMSIGVNLLFDLVKQAVHVLADSHFDIEILEKHHNQKIDAPSGTAMAIAEAVNEAAKNMYSYTYDRSVKREKRSPQEIGIHAIRGGTIVGEHDVIFAGKDEILTISHSAMSKEIFAVGAVKAARFLAGKPAGFYTMKHVIEQA